MTSRPSTMRLSVGPRLSGWLIAAALALAYIATAPVNRTDAEDAYDYAWQVEHARGRELLHPHHLLALSIFRAGHRAVTWLAPGTRAITTMGLMSAWAAAAAVVLIARLLRRTGIRDRRAELAAAALAVSFGFWRYAAEAELYALATAWCLGTWTCAAAELERDRPPWLSSVLGAGAILVHVFSVWATLVAVPLWLWRRDGLWRAIRYGAGVVVVVALAYLAAGQLPSHQVGGPDPLRSEGGLHPSAAIKAVIAAGSTIVAGHFALAEPHLAAWVRHRFPARMLDEELYLARRISPAWQAVAWTTLAACLAAALALITSVMRGRKRPNTAHGAIAVQGLDGDGRTPSKDWTALRCAAGAWWVGHGALLLWMEPGNPELWVMALPPLWMLLAGSPALRVRPWWVFVLLLGLHNWVGGMSLLRDPAGDLYRAKADAVLRVAQPGDEIWTAGGPSFSRYLRYVSAAKVVDLWAADPDDGRGRCIWVLGDVLEPPRALTERFWARAPAIAHLVAQIRPKLELVVSDSFGGVWRLCTRDRTAAAEASSGPSDKP